MLKRDVLTNKISRYFLRKKQGRVFISGTGRAGTTFIIQLMTEIGLDTGYSRNEDDHKPQGADQHFFDAARAGFERDIFAVDNPFIVKSPYLCDHVDDVLKAGIAIRHIIIPTRSVYEAAESRRLVQRETTGTSSGQGVAGGLWGTDDDQKQEEVLALKLSRLIEAAVRNEIPMTFLSFPRLVREPDYTYNKLKFLFPFTSKASFRRAFVRRQRLDWVHDFSDSEVYAFKDTKNST